MSDRCVLPAQCLGDALDLGGTQSHHWDPQTNRILVALKNGQSFWVMPAELQESLSDLLPIARSRLA